MRVAGLVSVISRLLQAGLLLVLFGDCALGQNLVLEGRVTDPKGAGIVQATVTLDATHQATRKVMTGSAGRFSFSGLAAGQYTLRVSVLGFESVVRTVSLGEGLPTAVDISLSISPDRQSVTVIAELEKPDILSSDPSQRVLIRDETLDANPGRPGSPVSIPGLPIETASGGIKAPQYFAPGVAGDHGEPIAQYILVGSYLVSNNLSANAHGNGYADPNILVPSAIDSVRTDGGAFNVREGNHSENLSETFTVHPELQPFATITGDYRDADLVAGISGSQSWILFQGSYGNGFLDRLEHRQQYKVNAYRTVNLGRHVLTLFAIGYYGFSYVPGLTPLHMPQSHDTIDPRQKDQTHTGLLAANDDWKLSSSQQLSFSGFFRTYNLALYSNFGDGLIRQSEFRTVVGGNSVYTNRFAEFLTLLAGADYQRDAPRRLDLDHSLSTDPAIDGPFEPVTANNLTIGDAAPYLAIAGSLVAHLHYYAGFRRDEIGFANSDLLVPAHSFSQWNGVNSPKATLAFSPRNHSLFPVLSLSAGEAFFTNDPRIGAGTASGTLVSRSRSYQLIASKTSGATDVRLTLGHVTTTASYAKIDPDTGLQFNEGPGRLRFGTLSVRHYLPGVMLQASLSKADARDVWTGQPTPEAPRTVLDFLGTWNTVPFHLQARGEFEYIGANPLGDGFTSMPIREFRFALLRPFAAKRMTVGVNLLIAGGYTGQTTETLVLPDDPSPTEQVVGVRLPSYVSLSYTYHF